MSDQIDKAFVQQYKNNVELLSQQMGSRLSGAVREERVNGEYAFFEQIGPTQAQLITGRHQDTPLVYTPHDRRRVGLADYDWADLVDRQDKVRTLIDPTNPYAQNAAYAFGRTKDAVIYTAAFATAYTGKTGATSVTFPTSQKIDVNDHTYDAGSGDVGLTVSKLIKARKILRANQVDLTEPLYLACSAGQLSDLLSTTQVTSSDYNSVKALVSGDVDTFMGFKFIHYEDVALESGDAAVVAWAKSGILLATGMEMTVDIATRPDKRNSTQVYVSMTIGATRMEEKKVVKILCNV